MRTAPGCDPNERHTQLKGDHAPGLHRGVLLPLWQIEVTDGGRIWYLIDEDNHTIWIQYASLRERATPQENRVTILTLRALAEQLEGVVRCLGVGARTSQPTVARPEVSGRTVALSRLPDHQVSHNALRSRAPAQAGPPPLLPHGHLLGIRGSLAPRCGDCGR
jgi:hypothetical protein